MKKWTWTVCLVVAVAGVCLLPIRSQEEGADKSAVARKDDIRARLQHMQRELRDIGAPFSVGDNPALQYPLAQLCTFSPALCPADAQLAEQAGVAVVSALPAAYIGYYTPIKSPGGCGAGWAFASVAPFEGAIKKATGTTVDLSEQYLISCNTKGYGCNGGWFLLEMFVNPGGVLESCFPYVGYAATCKSTCPKPYKARSWGYVGTASGVPAVNAIKTAIYNYGSVAAAVYVDSYFQAYTGGVFNRCSSKSPNHTVVLVGWDDAKGAWRIKNCWGTGWGESGLMWIKYGCSKIGYAACYVVY